MGRLVQAKVHMSLSKASNGLWIPWQKRALEAQRALCEPKTIVPQMAEDAVRAAKMAGYELVRKDKLEEMEWLLTHYPVGGGAEMADYLEQEIMEFLFAETAIFATPAGTSYVSLQTDAVAQTDADAATEVSNSGTAYARQLVESDGVTSPFWTAPGATGGAVENNGAVTFPTATASWGTVAYAAIHDVVTHASGNMWFWSALNSNKVVDNGDVFQFANGDIDISIA